MSTETQTQPVEAPPASAKKVHWKTAQKLAKEGKSAAAPTKTAPKAQKPAITPVFEPDEAPAHKVTECDPAKKVIFGQTHWITFTLPNGSTQQFAHKGKPKPADIIAIHRSMMVKYNRELELKRQAEERHAEAVKRMTSN